MQQVWCRSGKTGILGLLLCLYWQAEYCGTGHAWKGNIKAVEQIFNAILSEPDLEDLLIILCLTQTNYMQTKI